MNKAWMGALALLLAACSATRAPAPAVPSGREVGRDISREVLAANDGWAAAGPSSVKRP